jgi:hypothetical protein
VAILSAVLLGVGGLTVVSPFASRGGAYLADRNVGLAILIVVLFLARWSRAVGAVLMATAAMHVVDGFADIRFDNPPAAIGSFVVAALSALAALWFLSSRDRAQT